MIESITDRSQLGDLRYLKQHNKDQLAFAIKNLYEAEESTSIVMNHPALLMRKKSSLYPEGRTSYRFKRELRNKVTIVGKTQFKLDTKNDVEDDKEEEGTKEGEINADHPKAIEDDLTNKLIALGKKKKSKGKGKGKRMGGPVDPNAPVRKANELDQPEHASREEVRPLPGGFDVLNADF